jgi:hypothetical protein
MARETEEEYFSPPRGKDNTCHLQGSQGFTLSSPSVGARIRPLNLGDFRRPHRVQSNVIYLRPSGLAVLEFFVPGHLDGFEFAFVRSCWVAGKSRELGDPFVHIGEPDGERIGVGKFVG